MLVGSVAGLLLSIYAGVVYWLAPNRVLELGVTLPELIGLYLVAGPIAGIILGILLPLGRWRLGAMFVGLCAAFPLYAGSFALLMPPSDWFPDGLIMALFLAELIGMPLGYLAWKDGPIDYP